MLRSLAVTVACLVAGGVAAANSARVRWRGVAVEGRAPTALQPAVAAHVAVALRSLGSSLVTAGPEDAEAAASCAFPSSAKIARCMVVVKVGSAARAERRQEIRYRDAEDLAESLALLVSDILTSEFPDIVGGKQVAPPPHPATQNPSSPNPSAQNSPSPNSPSPNPSPTGPPPPPPPPTVEQQKAHEAEMQRQLEIVKSLQKQADEARAVRARDEAARARDEAARARDDARRRPSPSPPPPSPPPSTRVAVDVAAAGVFGLGAANPTLVGGDARALYARARLRVGASLSLTGMRETLAGHDLSFLRAVLAARAGIGFAGAVADFDLTGGPALLVLVDDAHAEGRHAVASVAFVAGPRLALTLSGPLALVAGADLAIAITDERVTADGARVAQFSRASVEVTLGLAWRSRIEK